MCFYLFTDVEVPTPIRPVSSQTDSSFSNPLSTNSRQTLIHPPFNLDGEDEGISGRDISPKDTGPVDKRAHKAMQKEASFIFLRISIQPFIHVVRSDIIPQSKDIVNVLNS